MADGNSRSYRLEVISPERVLLDTRARSLSLMTEDGSIGVLYGHAPLVASVVPCAMTLDAVDGGRTALAIGEGFIEVTGEEVRVLVDSAERASDIDVERAEAARKRAEDHLHHRGHKETDVPRAEAALRRALARLKTAGKL